MTLVIGELWGGGFVPSWRCGSRCRHCLYGCGPHRRDGEAGDRAALEALLDQMAARGRRVRWHIGGGEPFLDRERLAAVVRGMVARGLTIEYVETSAVWVADVAQATRELATLADLGLRCVLVSLSPFHAEFVPFGRTRALLEAARRVLPQGAFVWIPDFVDELADAPADAPLDLSARLVERGDAWALGLADRYHLVPAGRAGRFRAAHGERRAWTAWVDRAPCRARLADTSHFHLDAAGNYVPGLCAGLALPFAAVPGEIDLERYPVLRLLAAGDLAGVVDLAGCFGFTPSAAGYAAACDLCTQARLALAANAADRFPELAPAGFYDPASMIGGRDP